MTNVDIGILCSVNDTSISKRTMTNKNAVSNVDAGVQAENCSSSTSSIGCVAHEKAILDIDYRVSGSNNSSWVDTCQ